MPLARIYNLTDTDLPESLYHVRDIFLPPKQSTDNAQPVENSAPLNKTDRGRTESLHDYLARKNIACWCRNCRAEKKRLEQENNLSLV